MQNYETSYFYTWIFKRKIVKQLIIALATLAVLITLAIGVPVLFGSKLGDVIGGKNDNLAELLFQIPYTIIFVGFGEEILFRGYFLERIKAITNSNIAAILVSSVLFGVWHFPVSYSLMQVLITTIIGMLFAFVRIRIKNGATLSVGLSHGLYDATINLLWYFCV